MKTLVRSVSKVLKMIQMMQKNASALPGNSSIQLQTVSHALFRIAVSVLGIILLLLNVVTSAKWDSA